MRRGDRGRALKDWTRGVAVEGFVVEEEEGEGEAEGGLIERMRRQVGL